MTFEAPVWTLLKIHSRIFSILYAAAAVAYIVGRFSPVFLFLAVVTTIVLAVSLLLQIYTERKRLTISEDIITQFRGNREIHRVTVAEVTKIELLRERHFWGEIQLIAFASESGRRIVQVCENPTAITDAIRSAKPDIQVTEDRVFSMMVYCRDIVSLCCLGLLVAAIFSHKLGLFFLTSSVCFVIFGLSQILFDWKVRSRRIQVVSGAIFVLVGTVLLVRLLVE